MRRTASSVLRDLEIRVARLEKQSNLSLSGVGLDFIKKYRKSLNRLLTSAGIEIRPTHKNAANIFLTIEGVEGHLEIEDFGQDDNLHVQHKLLRGRLGKSSSIDVREFVSLNPETGRSSLWDLKDWNFDKESFVDAIIKIASVL